MKKKVYIITGAPDARKSSVIRALTGIRDTKTFDIQFENSEKAISTHVMATSPNELDAKGYDRGMTPQQLIEYLKNLKKKETAVILPIRSVKPKFNLPVASEYIQVLVNEGFEIAKVAMFNDEILLPNGIQGEVFTSTEEIPSNLIASQLRELWGIV
jgi:hypothetical protein